MDPFFCDEITLDNNPAPIGEYHYMARWDKGVTKDTIRNRFGPPNVGDCWAIKLPGDLKMLLSWDGVSSHLSNNYGESFFGIYACLPVYTESL